MAQRTAWPQQGGILFVGDAAGFFDPFTGQGIYLALHSATLAATMAHRALCARDLSAQYLQHYYRTHQQAFHAKYRFSELIQLGIRLPWLANRLIERLARRPALADTVVSVAGDMVAPQAVLSWRFAKQLLL
jgi:flavin-dependent dehydrogenase